MKLEIRRPGRIGYAKAYELQLSLLEKRQKNEIPDTLILLEHPPVITIGKRGKDTDVLINRDLLAARGIELYETDRGGEVTYHGPGQIVGYLIFNVAEHGKDLHRFVSDLEQVFIDFLLESYGIEAGRDSGHTGVWVGNEKITAIGIAVRRWVSMHGFAFNVETDLDCFSLIVPCGIRDKGVTSLHKLTDAPAELHWVQEQIIRHVAQIYGFTEWDEVEKHDIK